MMLRLQQHKNSAEAKYDCSYTKLNSTLRPMARCNTSREGKALRSINVDRSDVPSAAVRPHSQSYRGTSGVQNAS